MACLPSTDRTNATVDKCRETGRRATLSLKKG
jgi:hypothetical protein